METVLNGTLFGMTFYQIIWYFLIYSFLGWCVEVAYQGVEKGLIVNRGFLNGPVCPIYGFGIIGILALGNSIDVKGAEDASALVLFFAGMIFATLLELIGGFALDKIFHARWWDYSGKPLNFRGYICLEFSVIWGLAIMATIRIFHPMTEHFTIDLIPGEAGRWLLLIACAAYFADFVVSVMIMNGLNKRMAELDELREKMRVVSNGLTDVIGGSSIEIAQNIQEGKVQAELARAELEDTAREMKEDFVTGALDLRDELSDGIEEMTDDLRSLYEEKRHDLEVLFRAHRVFGVGRAVRALADTDKYEYNDAVREFRKRLFGDRT